MNKGTIYFTLEGVEQNEIERYRELIHTLILQGAFNVKNGKVTLHYDHEGELQEIEFNIKRWRKNKPNIPLHFLEKSATISSQSQ